MPEPGHCHWRTNPWYVISGVKLIRRKTWGSKAYHHGLYIIACGSADTPNRLDYSCNQ
jgi:hypothetical protein